ncbi:MAG: rRNA maturation RNase YbeY [Alphaproteobacteria bacterium HGW-Alphaproteobacteria-12]|nr:MAG: rRNA maturation RNase YbeY [Alphaproteobacteria bacterium HGW-Alphaproteobacteria-12]
MTSPGTPEQDKRPEKERRSEQGKRRVKAKISVSGLEIEILHEAGEWDSSTDETVRRAAEHAYVVTRGGEPAELCIVLADDTLVANLNKTYRGKAGSTNVLSFPAAAMPDTGAPEAAFTGAQPLLGDVVLARETIAREAGEQNKKFADHLSHLIVHGVLHLLGHDHLDDGEAGEMEALERDILEDLGIADPYSANHSGH